MDDLSYWWEVNAPFVIMALIVLAVISVLICFSWVSAGIKAEFYQRQGIQITQSQVFWGCKPEVVRVSGVPDAQR
jgi:hypothetical protein